MERMWKLLSVFLILTLNLQKCRANHLKLGGMFDVDDQKAAFEFAIDKLNENVKNTNKHKFVGFAKMNDTVMASKQACGLLEEGVVAIFGPGSSKSSYVVDSICESKDISHLETRIDAYQHAGPNRINFYPHPSGIAKAVTDLVTKLDWTYFTLFYENGESLARLSKLLETTTGGLSPFTVVLRQIDLGMEKDYRAILNAAKNQKESNFIIDCSTQVLKDFLTQAQQVGLMTDEENYIITNLDMHTIDLTPFQYSGVNIMGFRLFNSKNKAVEDAVKDFNKYIKDKKPYRVNMLTVDKLSTESALIIDAIKAYALVLDAHFPQLSFTDKMSCSDSRTWNHGKRIIDHLKGSTSEGLTGKIQFEDGLRTKFTLYVVQLTKTGIKQIGEWNFSAFVLNQNSNDQQYSFEDNNIANRNLRIVVLPNMPYVGLKQSSDGLVGNDRFEGFGVDLIEEISKIVGFKYTFFVQPDRMYGILHPATKKWTGMIRTLIDNKADLGITDMTVTAQRSSAVDFTMPFMQLGISILTKKPTRDPPSLYFLLAPFTSQVWFYLGIAYSTIPMLIFILSRMSPKEWRNPRPSTQEPKQLENQFSVANSMFFTASSAFQQGSNLAPKAISTRIMAGIWWLFTLVVVCSYIANLAATLSVGIITYSVPINSADDLSKQDTIKYGTMMGGATFAFFKNSDHPTYKKIYEYMASHPEDMCSSYSEGVERVKNGKYAVFMESTTIEYLIERNCDLQMIGGSLNDRSYGIAMPKNSTYRDAINEAVLKLQESGVISSLKFKWWKEKLRAGECVEDMISSPELGWEHLHGVFLVLICGSFVAIFVAFVEMLLGVYSRSKQEKVKFGDVFAQELKFVFKPSKTKPAGCHGNNFKSSDIETNNIPKEFE